MGKSVNYLGTRKTARHRFRVGCLAAGAAVSLTVACSHPGSVAEQGTDAMTSSQDAAIADGAATVADLAPSLLSASDGGIAYNANQACINGMLYEGDVLGGKGEFGTNGFDRTYWGTQSSWGRLQYDTYFGAMDDGLPGGHDPFDVMNDTSAPGNPKALRISAMPMPADLVGNSKVSGKDYYAGMIDKEIELQYGFFVARVRTPAPAGGLSPAFWMLTSSWESKNLGEQGTGIGNGGGLEAEWDVQEMFGNVNWYPGTNGMNAGTILWNSGNENWGGTFAWPSSSSSAEPSGGYHDYGVLIQPGGASWGPPYDGSRKGPGAVDGQVTEGCVNFLDGVPLPGHIGCADITQGLAQKEIMAMFQVGPKGDGWLGNPSQTTFPQYYWIQWIRVYRPTTTPC